MSVIVLPEDALVSAKLMEAPGTAWLAEPVGAFVDEDDHFAVL